MAENRVKIVASVKDDASGKIGGIRGGSSRIPQIAQPLARIVIDQRVEILYGAGVRAAVAA